LAVDFGYFRSRLLQGLPDFGRYAVNELCAHLNGKIAGGVMICENPAANPVTRFEDEH
jgi:hypothetical protein